MDEHPIIEVGIEREGLRVTPQGRLAKTPHPAVYGDKLDNPSITVDYAEQQIETISIPATGTQEVYDRALALARIVQMQCAADGELFWPSSIPPENIREDDIEIARYGDDEKGRQAYQYRQYLARQYSKKRQLFCGVHYNISIQGADNEVYLRMARNFIRYGWFLIYAFGAAPDLTSPFSISLRQGEEGYHNAVELFADYSSVEAYCASVERFIAQGDLCAPKEFYAPIRLKSVDAEHPLDSLRKQGIRYLEIRTFDIDPFDEAGISKETLTTLEKFVSFLARSEDASCDETAQREGAYNRRLVADRGLNPDACLRIEGREVPLSTQLARMGDLLDLPRPIVPRAKQIRDACMSDGFHQAMLKQAKSHQQHAYETRWTLAGFEDWELSTQILIKEALRRGLSVEALDKEDNLVRITRRWATLPTRSEYVMQATRTGADSYITPLLMNNKAVAKRILTEHGIPTPEGEQCTDADCSQVLERWVGRPAVIKPRSTNFGIGVTIFSVGTTQEQLREAASGAFAHDHTILVETYLPGTEYRFLVIGGAVVGVLQRKPANVVGDGVSTIEALIARKNEHPYRTQGYRTPLIAIKPDDAVREFIARRGYTLQSVPDADECVLLRPNSNISTGGDSIDVTDQIHPYFKELAIRSADAFGATFCGVDLIIEDRDDPVSSHGVIEVNWNPAIHIHTFPAYGKEHSIAPAVLRAIGLIPSEV